METATASIRTFAIIPTPKMVSFTSGKGMPMVDALHKVVISMILIGFAIGLVSVIASFVLSLGPIGILVAVGSGVYIWYTLTRGGMIAKK
jgi:hypothetical protein